MRRRGRTSATPLDPVHWVPSNVTAAVTPGRANFDRFSSRCACKERASAASSAPFGEGPAGGVLAPHAAIAAGNVAIAAQASALGL